MEYLYIAASLALLVLLVLLYFRLDCDLTLAWNLYFGKPPEALTRKVVWVTGCSSGIGEALALRLAAAGCRLVLSARRENMLNDVKRKCIELSGGKLTADDILVLPLDLLAYDSHPAAVETVLKYFKQIDILVNNAGRSQRGLIMDTDTHVDRQVFDLDLTAPISLSKAVLPHMVARGQGQFVVTSSVAGKYGAPGSASYSAAKHALQGFFDSLRIECHHSNISVTMVCPGPVFSDALIHAFTDKPDQKLNMAMDRGWKRMTAARCAELMAVAAANQLDEVWVSPNPELLYCYLFQYMPYIGKKIAVKFGQSRVSKVKSGVANLH